MSGFGLVRDILCWGWSGGLGTESGLLVFGWKRGKLLWGVFRDNFREYFWNGIRYSFDLWEDYTDRGWTIDTESAGLVLIVLEAAVRVHNKTGHDDC